MEENKKADQEAKELNLEKMEQISGGADSQTEEYKYCSFCQKETRWVNGVCTEIHRRPIKDLQTPGQ